MWIHTVLDWTCLREILKFSPPALHLRDAREFFGPPSFVVFFCNFWEGPRSASERPFFFDTMTMNPAGNKLSRRSPLPREVPGKPP